MHDPSRGPEDFFDTDNPDRAAFMADYGHNFQKQHSPTATGGSSRWSFSLNKLLIALAIILLAGPFSTAIMFIAAVIFGLGA